MNENTPDPDEQDPDADFDAEVDDDHEGEYPSDGFGAADPSDIPSADVTTEAKNSVQT